MALYGSVEYWNKRYTATAHLHSVEWYRSYSNLRHLLNPISFSTLTGSSNKINDVSNTAPSASQPTANKATTRNSTVATTWPFPSREDCKVLILGCGCSSFGEDMIRDGWTGRIVNVDFSPVVIEQMKLKYNDTFYENLARKRAGNNTAKVAPKADINRMEFICADATDEAAMTKLFDDSSFDLILCKATLDAILNTSTPMINAQKMIRQCRRMLADQHGILFVATNGNPDNRLEIFEHENNLHYYWQNVSIHSLNNHGGGKQQHQNQHLHQTRSTSSTCSTSNERNVYIYICRKRTTSTSHIDKENLKIIAS